MTLCLIFVPLAFVLGLEYGLWLKRPPLCTCDDPRCGGGCIDWEQ